MDKSELNILLRKLKSDGIKKGDVAKSMGIGSGHLSDMLAGRKTITEDFSIAFYAEYGSHSEIISKNIEKSNKSVSIPTGEIKTVRSKESISKEIRDESVRNVLVKEFAKLKAKVEGKDFETALSEIFDAIHQEGALLIQKQSLP